MMVLGIDVGSVRRRGGFAWSSADGTLQGADDPAALGDEVVRALQREPVALAVEAPLSVPVPTADREGGRELGRARTGEQNRPWSAGAGAGTLATGLVQLTWLAGYLADRTGPELRATTGRKCSWKAGPT